LKAGRHNSLVILTTSDELTRHPSSPRAINSAPSRRSMPVGMARALMNSICLSFSTAPLHVGKV